MQMKDVYDLLARFEQSNLSELSVKMEGVSFHGKKGYVQESAGTQAYVQTEKSEVLLESRHTANPVNVKQEESNAEADNTNRVAVTAQIAGTFYRAPSPESEPFVKVGQTVKKGDTLGLLEAMKMMSNVVAPADGIVKEMFKKLVGEDAAVVNVPKWLESAKGSLRGTVVAMPARDDIDFPVEEHLIVELYSK